MSCENAAGMSVSSTGSKFCGYDVTETSDLVLFTVLMCSDSIFNLLKRVTDGSYAPH